VIRDPGWKNPDPVSGMEKFGFWDKNPLSLLWSREAEIKLPAGA
jgi:hypothetical protein